MKSVSWQEMQRLYVGGKYRGRVSIPGWNAKTVRVIDVNLGGDVVVAMHRDCCHPVIAQIKFLEWVKNAKVLEASDGVTE